MTFIKRESKPSISFGHINTSKTVMEELLSIYLISIGICGVLLEGNIIYYEAQWTLSYVCVFLNIISGFYVVMSPLISIIQTVAHQILLHQISPSRRYFSFMLLFILFICLWGIHLGITLFIFIYGPSGSDRYCFGLFPLAHGQRIYIVSMTALYLTLNLILRLCMLVYNGKKFQQSQNTFKKRSLSKHEKVYLFVSGTDIIFILLKSITFVYLMISFFLINNLTSVQKGVWKSNINVKCYKKKQLYLLQFQVKHLADL